MIQLWEGDNEKSQLRKYQALTFTLTFMSVAAFHFQNLIKSLFQLFKATRSGWSYCHNNLITQLKFTDKEISYLNMTWLLSLGIGLQFGGSLGDRVNPKKFVLIGAFTSMAIYCIVGFLGIAGSQNLGAYIFLIAIIGLFQAVSSPSSNTILSYWFSKKYRGIIMSLFMGARSLGDIAGYIIGHISIDVLKLKWYNTIFYCLLFCMFVFLFHSMFLFYHPKCVDLAIKDNQQKTKINDDENNDRNQHNNNLQSAAITGPLAISAVSLQEKQEDKKEIDSQKDLFQVGERQVHESQKDDDKQSIGFLYALRIQGIILQGLSLGCIKSLGYGMLFWFPYYLETHGIQSERAGISTAYSVFVFFGGLTAGHIGDVYKKRFFIMPPFLILLIVCLNLIDETNGNQASLYIISSLIGFFLGGPMNVLAGAVIIDLGKHPQLEGQRKAVSTVTGIIEGIAIVMAAMVQLLIPIFGNDQIFITFTCLAIGSVIFLSPKAIKEYAMLWEEHENQSNPQIEEVMGQQIQMKEN